LLKPLGQAHSLQTISVADGFTSNRRGQKQVILGLDMRYFYLLRNPNFGGHAILEAIFNRLACYAASPITIVAVFDGDQRPKFKRGVKVKMSPHKLKGPIEKLLEAFGFHHLTAPGEAEAQLAHMNQSGAIDAIISEDSDTFIFGGLYVIRRGPTKDYNDIILYDISLNSLLSPPALLFIAILCGGDYDKVLGLHGCGILIAYALCQTDLPNTLYNATSMLTNNELEKFLIDWRVDLATELETNSGGHLLRREPALARSITRNFPDPRVLHLYVNPPVIDVNTSSWHLELPNLPKLVDLCERYFTWVEDGLIVTKFNRYIWQAYVTRQLIQVCQILYWSFYCAHVYLNRCRTTLNSRSLTLTADGKL
ncbi:PIN domain-like protein, partial [Mycena floridula]